MAINPELRIYGVSPLLHDELINIAANHGLSFTDFMKPHLRTISGMYPEHFKKPYVKVIINNDTTLDEKAKTVADLCQPCSKEVWGKVYRSALVVLKEDIKK